MERDDIKKELDSLQSSLKMIKKESYKLPENYFSDMQDSVLQRIQKEEKKEKTKLVSFPNILSLVAVMVIVLAAILVIRSNINKEISFDDLSEEMVLSYLNENIQEIPEYTLIEYYDEGQSDLEDLQEDELEEYLEEYMEEEDEYYLEQLL